MNKPALIDPEENEREVKSNRTFKQSDDFRFILAAIYEKGIFGSDVTSKRAASEKIYKLTEVSDLGIRKTTQERTTNWGFKGDVRLSAIMGHHKRNVTYREADHFLYYFLKFVGPK
ncbi:MAG: hypothetical protein AAFP97_11945, partial [Pseudomonadota bacterium]